MKNNNNIENKTFLTLMIISGFLLLSLNPVNSVSCNIGSCQDIRGLALSCPVVSLSTNIQHNGGQDCIIMQGQSLNLNGFTITGIGSYNSPFRHIYLLGSGSVFGGNIDCSADSSVYGIYVASQTGSIVLHDLNILSSIGVYINSGSGVVYMTNLTIQGGITTANDINANNVTLIDSTGLTLSGNDVHITLNAFTSYNNNLYGLNFGIYNNTIISLNSARICSNTNTDIKQTTGTGNVINNLGDYFFYDISSNNITYSGNTKHDCFEFVNFTNENITENESENITCNSALYPDLDSIGLYGFTLFQLYNIEGNIDKYGFKVKIKNETLYNSLNVTLNRIKLKKLGSDFYYIKNSESSNNMRDTVYSNLEGYNYSQLTEFKQDFDQLDMFEGFIYGILGVRETIQKTRIGNAYCSDRNPNCNFLGCACKGFYYEIDSSNIISGSYGIYIELKSNDSCIYSTYTDKITLNGSFQQDLTNNGLLPSIPSGKNPDNYDQVPVNVKLYCGMYLKDLNSGDTCNVTTFCQGYENLKESDLIFFLTANTSNNSYSDSDILEFKESEFNEIENYYQAIFDICDQTIYNLSYDKIGFFTKILDQDRNEFLNIGNQGYIGTGNRSTESGIINNYYYYINNESQAYFKQNDTVTTSINAEDIYYKLKDSLISDFIMIVMIISVIAIIGLGLIKLFTKSTGSHK